MRTTRPSRSVRRPLQLSVKSLESRETPSTGGLLDPTFGSGGVVTSFWSSSKDGARDVVVQPDGKIVAVGQTNLGTKTGIDFVVARYNPNGTLDTGFGSGGRVTTDFNQDYDSARAAAIQPGTGKLLVAGIAQKTTKVRGTTVTNQDFALVRYTATGVDTTFGTGGKVETDMGSAGDAAYAMAVQPDGKIVLAGRVAGLNYQYVALARYTAAGALDPTFGNGGKVVTSIPNVLGEPMHPMAVQIQSDGRIVLVGTNYTGSTEDFEVVRFNPDGSLDPTFGGTGWVTTDFGGRIDNATGLLIQSDGRLVVAGETRGNDDQRIGLARYLAQDTVIGGVSYPAGSLDPTFGSGGTVIAALPQPPDPSQRNYADTLDMAIQADGRIVVGGREYGATTGGLAERFNADGSVDTGYGTAGTGIELVPDNGGITVVAVAIQPDGKAVFLGNTPGTQSSNDLDFALFRLLPSAPQVGSFTADSNPASADSTVILSAAGLTDGNVGATVTQVAFYADTNGNGVLDSGDSLLGYGNSNNGTWTLSWSTAGYAAGTYKLFVQATDSLGAVGDSVGLTLELI